jgi:GNAT superfamily N-acetyltransferase
LQPNICKQVLASHQKLANGKYPICAFYTVAPSAIRRQTLPPHLAKKLPHYPVPVFLLAQLAVSLDYQGQGLGKITLIQSLEYLWRVNQYLTAYAVVVDCLNESAKKFYQLFGFELLDEDNSKTRLFLPMKTIEQLFNT